MWGTANLRVPGSFVASGQSLTGHGRHNVPLHQPTPCTCAGRGSPLSRRLIKNLAKSYTKKLIKSFEANFLNKLLKIKFLNKNFRTKKQKTFEKKIEKHFIIAEKSFEAFFKC
jgi:hypothetical protein